MGSFLFPNLEFCGTGVALLSIFNRGGIFNVCDVHTGLRRLGVYLTSPGPGGFICPGHAGLCDSVRAQQLVTQASVAI